MAISKIKPDENGSPDHAKYRIVVLGNLDPHDWSNSDYQAAQKLNQQILEYTFDVMLVHLQRFANK
jgi:hypothetical protein